MAGKEGCMPDYYRPQKRQRVEVIVEGNASPSFSNEMLQSFSFKNQNDDDKIHTKAELRRSLRATTSNNGTKEKAIGNQSKRIKNEIKPPEKEEDVEHLPVVQDIVKEDMDILIIGSNPGRMSSRKGQHFSHPSNHFYRALHRSNLTPIQISPSQDFTILDQISPYLSIGLTNLVARPTRMAQELNKTEEAIGTEILIDLIRRYRPKVGLFIGIGVARSFERSLAQMKKLSKVKMEEEADVEVTINIAREIPLVNEKTLGLGVGLMKVGIRHSTGFTLLFSMPSTSGRVTTHQLKEKTACMAAARLLTMQLNTDIKGDRQQVNIRLI